MLKVRADFTFWDFSWYKQVQEQGGQWRGSFTPKWTIPGNHLTPSSLVPRRARNGEEANSEDHLLRDRSVGVEHLASPAVKVRVKD